MAEIGTYTVFSMKKSHLEKVDIAITCIIVIAYMFGYVLLAHICVIHDRL